MTQTTQNNQKVTNAKILSAIEHLEGKVDENHTDIKKAIEHTTRCEERWQSHMKAHKDLSEELKAVKDNKGWMAALGVAVTAGITSIGAWLKQ
jgi:hypothetical protein